MNNSPISSGNQHFYVNHRNLKYLYGTESNGDFFTVQKAYGGKLRIIPDNSPQLLQGYSVRKSSTKTKPNFMLGHYIYEGSQASSRLVHRLVARGPANNNVNTLSGLLESRLFMGREAPGFLRLIVQQAKSHPLLLNTLRFGALQVLRNPRFRMIVMPKEVMGNTLGSHNRGNTIKLQEGSSRVSPSIMIHELMHLTLDELAIQGQGPLRDSGSINELFSVYKKTLVYILSTFCSRTLTKDEDTLPVPKLAIRIWAEYTTYSVSDRVRYLLNELLRIGDSIYSKKSEMYIASEILSRFVDITYKYPRESDVQTLLKPLYDYVAEELLPVMEQRIAQEPSIPAPAVFKSSNNIGTRSTAVTISSLKGLTLKL